MLSKFFGLQWILFIGLVCFHSLALASPVYAQLFSTVEQTATPDTVNQPIPILLQISNISGMAWDASSNKLSIKQDGVYIIMAGIQAGANEQAQNIIKGGDIYYWINLNNAPIPNTSSWVFASPQSRSKNISSIWIAPFKAGDSLQFMYASSASSMGIIGKVAMKNFPGAPGATVGVFKLE
jgi:hypothetical protein